MLIKKKNHYLWQWFFFDIPLRQVWVGKYQRAEVVLPTSVSVLSDITGLFPKQHTWGFGYKLPELQWEFPM